MTPPFDLCERTFEFTLHVLELSMKLNRKTGFPRSLSGQLLRAGTSIGANVEEGRAGQSKADFVSKYSIARKEAREAKYWLRLFVASKLVESDEGNPLVQEADELIRILTAIIKKAKGV
jgi:four helix bundle protein